MTYSSSVPLDSDHDTETTSLEDTPILGPKWIKLPALTFGFIGVSALWSTEMSYGASPRNLEFCVTHILELCSFAIFVISGFVKIPHGHRVHRGPVVRSHCSAARWYGRQPRHPIAFVLKFSNPGVLADNSKSRFGRRRPFMIGGAIVTAAATVLFGFTRPVAGMFSEEGSRLVRSQFYM